MPANAARIVCGQCLRCGGDLVATDMESLNRFKSAQADPFSGFDTALAEIKSGRKRGHWIWYVFPQLAGLGQSAASQTYGIRDRAEAQAYLRDPELRQHLLTITTAVAERLRESPAIEHLMGSRIDAMKLVSSLTLFGTVARELYDRERTPQLFEFVRAADDVLAIAVAQGYGPCHYTLGVLGA